MENDNPKHHYEKFPGFPPEPTIDFWCYPKALNGYWHSLNGSEQKVLDYILRHTWGFNKTRDDISLTQLASGIKNFDKGTGLTRPTVIAAIKTLVARGFIKKTKGKYANHYELVKNFNYHSKKLLPSDSKKSLPTITNYTIKNIQYVFQKGKPFYKSMQMRKRYGKWEVNCKGEWREYGGRESEIEWQKYGKN